MKALFISEVKFELERISRILKNQYKDLEIILASSKEEALNFASVEGPFGFYALDAEAKGYNPDELGKELLEFTGDRPVVFLGNETTITDRISHELYNANEYNERILRPFERDDFKDDLLNKISSALNFAKKEQFENSIEEVNPEDYIPMKIKSFYLFNSFPYDIFMEITPTRYIKILEAEKRYSLRTLSTYAKKNVKYLHIQKDDQLQYLENESKKCLKALRRVPVRSADMPLILLRSITLTHQTLLSIGVTPIVLTLSNATTDVIIELSSLYKTNFGELLKKYPSVYAGIASKSLLTGILSVALASKMGWESETTQKKLAISALLMDFTLMDEEMSSLNGPSDPALKNFNEEQLKNYFSHPIKAAEVARQFTMFPDVDFLVENHQETPTRKGFPNQPNHTKLNPLCSVLNISQFIAAEIDGKKINNQLLAKTLRSLSRDYNAGNFKETMKQAANLMKV